MPQLGHDIINFCLNWTRSHKLSMPQLGHNLINYQCPNPDTISKTINASTLTRSHKLSMPQPGHNLRGFLFAKQETNYSCLVIVQEPVSTEYILNYRLQIKYNRRNYKFCVAIYKRS